MKQKRAYIDGRCWLMVSLFLYKLKIFFTRVMMFSNIFSNVTLHGNAEWEKNKIDISKIAFGNYSGSRL